MFRDVEETLKLLISNSDDHVVYECITLDGRCLFKIADQQSNISTRVQEIQGRLENLAQTYLENTNVSFEITKAPIGDLWNIFVTINRQETRLLTVTQWDAQIGAMTTETKAEQIIGRLRIGFNNIKKERRTSYLISQSFATLGVVLVMTIISLLIFTRLKRFERSKKYLGRGQNFEPSLTAANLNNSKKSNIREVFYRFLQFGESLMWCCGLLFILGLFPYTRLIQFLLINWLRIPLKLALVILSTYVVIRISYIVINYFTDSITTNDLLTPGIGQRAILRFSTIASVAKSVLAGVSIIIGGLIALILLGVNVGPLITGIGLLGVGLSLASQQLIKDVINGFFIILEDQYAVGDLIEVGQVDGIVESINLRVTKLRDAQGKLISVPNSEIRIVANCSNQWSRADLRIPVAYQTNVEKALEIVRELAEQLSQDSDWKDKIIEPPEILGVDSFATQGLIIRVWIKTVPLEQWKVAREFRRRLKIAFDECGIILCLPQQIWINETSGLN